MRFAGTWKQYSKKAMPQLAKTTFHSASLRYLRWPYHANVMKMFESMSKRIVRTIVSRTSHCFVVSGAAAKLDRAVKPQAQPCAFLREWFRWSPGYSDLRADTAARKNR